MDTLSHGLWATAVGKGINLKCANKIKLRWMALWGILPDIFAFTPVLIWMLWQMFYKGVDFGEIPRPEIMSLEERNSFFILRLSETLYHISHSFVVFLALFFLLWILRWYTIKHKQQSQIPFPKPTHNKIFECTPCWEMTGWFIHILMDIPTHSVKLYPTLFLWPLSNWCFDGNSWGNMRFMIANYSSLLIVFILVSLVKRNKAK